MNISTNYLLFLKLSKLISYVFRPFVIKFEALYRAHN